MRYISGNWNLRQVAMPDKTLSCFLDVTRVCVYGVFPPPPPPPPSPQKNIYIYTCIYIYSMTPEACPSRNGNWLAKMSSFIAEGWMCLCYSVGSERWLCGGLVVMAVMAATAGMSEHRGGGGGGERKKKKLTVTSSALVRSTEHCAYTIRNVQIYATQDRST